jgi:hypothetical protein
MKRIVIRAAVATAVASIVTGLALAGVVIEIEARGPKEDPKTHNSTMYVEPDRLSMNVGETSAIFRADKDTMWVIRDKEGKYTEMTREDAKRLGEQVSGAMAEMQKQLASMPPEQRAMVEKMMAGKMPPPEGEKKAEAPVTYKKSGKTETINGFPCTSYDAMRGDKRQQEIWVTDWKRFDMSPADFKVFERFADFMKEMVGPMTRQFGTSLNQKFTDAEGGDGIPGVPIRTVAYTDRGEIVTEIKKIAKESIPASKFEVPQGLKKESMMDAMDKKPAARERGKAASEALTDK